LFEKLCLQKDIYIYRLNLVARKNEYFISLENFFVNSSEIWNKKVNSIFF
jgi:hypothetical protein